MPPNEIKSDFVTHHFDWDHSRLDSVYISIVSAYGEAGNGVYPAVPKEASRVTSVAHWFCGSSTMLLELYSTIHDATIQDVTGPLLI